MEDPSPVVGPHPADAQPGASVIQQLPFNFGMIVKPDNFPTCYP